MQLVDNGATAAASGWPTAFGIKTSSGLLSIMFAQPQVLVMDPCLSRDHRFSHGGMECLPIHHKVSDYVGP